jgi:hypothetical protein
MALAPAPAPELYRHFNITADNAVGNWRALIA